MLFCEIDYGVNSFTSPGASSGPTAHLPTFEEEIQIAPQIPRQLAQKRPMQATGPCQGSENQGRGGIGASATEASLGGDSFLDSDLGSLIHAQRRLQPAKCSDDQIPLIPGDIPGGVIVGKAFLGRSAAEQDLGVGPRPNREGITQIDGEHDRVQVVIAVGTLPDHFEKQIDFARNVTDERGWECRALRLFDPHDEDEGEELGFSTG